MRTQIILFLIWLPLVGLSQQDECFPRNRVNSNSPGWAQRLIDLKINKTEQFISDDSTGQNSILLSRFIRDQKENNVWGEYRDRWGRISSHTYYSFNNRNQIDTILNFDAERLRINKSTYFVYNSDNQLIKKEVVYASGSRTTTKYSIITSEKGVLKEEERYKDSLVFKASRYYLPDGKLAREKTDDFSSSLHYEIHFLYEDGGNSIRKTHFRDGDTTFTTLIFKNGDNVDASFFFPGGDTIPDYYSTFDPERNVRRSEFFDFDSQHQIVHCYFDEKKRRTKKVIEIVSIHRPEQIEIQYNEYGLPISHLIYDNGKFWRLFHFKYSFE